MKAIVAATAALFLVQLGASSPAMAAAICTRLLHCPFGTFPSQDRCRCDDILLSVPCVLICLGPNEVPDNKACRCVASGRRMSVR